VKEVIIWRGSRLRIDKRSHIHWLVEIPRMSSAPRAALFPQPGFGLVMMAM
jgi:hypothetical protein